METFVTVTVILAMIALGVLLIHLANRQHGDRAAAPRAAAPGRPPGNPASGKGWGGSS